MALTKEQQAAFLLLAEAFGFGVATASETVAAADPVKVGEPDLPNGYFSAEAVAKGNGYRCSHPTKPCGRLLQGPNRTAAHRGRKGHTPAK